MTSSNPLLEFCLDGGFSRKDSSRSAAAAEDSIPILTTTTTTSAASQRPQPQTSLLSQCSTCSDWLSSDPMLEAVDLHLRQTGCDINVQDVQGKTALHHLIQGMYRVTQPELLYFKRVVVCSRIYDTHIVYI